MRITVRLPDALLAQARREARRRGETLTSLIEKGLRKEVANHPARDRKREIEIPVFRGGTGVAPDVDLTNSAALGTFWTASSDLCHGKMRPLPPRQRHE